MTSLIELPPDMIERVMMKLDRFSLTKTMLVCNQFNEIANGELVWRQLIMNEFGLQYLQKPSQSWKDLFRLIYQQKPAIPQHQAEGILGCSHYQRGSMIQAPCCQKFYSCHVCHDEKEQHKIDRFKIETMVCMNCRMVQPTAQKCLNCSFVLASYYCRPCGVWSNDSSWPLHHCDKCRLCRVGKNEETWHCDKCGVCFEAGAIWLAVEQIYDKSRKTLMIVLTDGEDNSSKHSCDEVLKLVRDHPNVTLDIVHIDGQLQPNPRYQALVQNRGSYQVIEETKIVTEVISVVKRYYQ